MGILIRALVAAIISASVASAPRPLQAQGVSTPGLTAAFIFSFVKFTTWPAGALRDGTAIVICVIGNEQITDALVQITYGKTVEGHPLGIRRTELDRPMTECHVVFGASLNRNTAQELIRATTGYPILTVSDFEDFAMIGGVANFFIDGGRMRFKVNPDAAERQGLRISSNLLTLARVVRDAPTAR